MKHSHCIVPVIVLVLALAPGELYAAPDDNPGPSTPPALTGADSVLAAADVAFGFELLKTAAAGQGDQNIVISPLSISLGLAMVANGAAGSTHEAIMSTLQLEGMPDSVMDQAVGDMMERLNQLNSYVTVAIANSVWIDQDITVKEPFPEICRRDFRAAAEQLDFAAPDTPPIINGWVSDHTMGKIPSIVPSRLDPLTMMMLVNAVYFKGTWMRPFGPLSVPQPFYLPDGDSVNAPYMKLDTKMRHYHADSFDALALPYDLDDFKMILILPTRRDGLDDVMNLMNAETWQRVVSSMKIVPAHLRLPRFTVTTEVDLMDVLSQLGMAVAFRPGQANFSRIADRSDLHISSVLHRTFMAVDEHGTEAGAATAYHTIRVAGTPPDELRLTFDHPFLLAIREQASGALLFLGRITDPTAE